MPPPDPLTPALSDPVRLAAVEALGLSDGPQQELFARLNRIAVQLLGVPVSILSLITDDRQVHAAQVGLDADEFTHSEFPLSHSFCKNVVATGQALIVPDAREHPTVKDNGSVEDNGVIAYAGFPLRLASGEVVGAFCAIDSEPHEWTPEQLEIVKDLTALASELLDHRRAQNEQNEGAR
ncbi:MAG: GAF domain-containing protein [Solirubrobacteraceae bacterium]|nr:GAF domain-containing protein [Solirubrobacteraceae bacterium]